MTEPTPADPTRDSPTVVPVVSGPCRVRSRIAKSAIPVAVIIAAPENAASLSASMMLWFAPPAL